MSEIVNGVNLNAYSKPEHLKDNKEHTGLLQAISITSLYCSCSPDVRSISSGISISDGRLVHKDLCDTCEKEVIGVE